MYVRIRTLTHAHTHAHTHTTQMHAHTHTHTHTHTHHTHTHFTLPPTSLAGTSLKPDEETGGLLAQSSTEPVHDL